MATADSDASPLGEGLVYEDTLPLRVCEVEAEITGSRLSAIQESNEEILRIIAALDEHHVEGAEEDAQHHSQDLQRIESKLDLLLDMVADMLAGQLAIPPALPVRLNARAIEWRQPDRPPAQGRRVLLDLYLQHKFPRPLVLPGKVADVRQNGSGYVAVVRFEGMSDTVQNRLEKLIFRQHRRSVAHARRRQQGGGAGS